MSDMVAPRGTGSEERAAVMERPVAGDRLTAEDLAVLRRFEPVLCFNLGEQFYPMDVDRFLAGARLWIQRPGTEAEEIIPRRQLDAQTLGRASQAEADVPSAVAFLTVAEPLTAAQVRAFRKSSTLKDFHVGRGRLV